MGVGLGTRRQYEAGRGGMGGHRARSVIEATHKANDECTNKQAQHRWTLKALKRAGTHAQPTGTAVRRCAHARKSLNFGWWEQTFAGTIDHGRKPLSQTL